MFGFFVFASFILILQHLLERQNEREKPRRPGPISKRSHKNPPSLVHKQSTSRLMLKPNQFVYYNYYPRSSKNIFQSVNDPKPKNVPERYCCLNCCKNICKVKYSIYDRKQKCPLVDTQTNLIVQVSFAESVPQTNGLYQADQRSKINTREIQFQNENKSNSKLGKDFCLKRSLFKLQFFYRTKSTK